MKRLSFFLLLLFSCLPLISFGQDVEMADQFRADGKIYVVVTIALTILIGIGIYLFLLDRKISKIEERLKK